MCRSMSNEHLLCYTGQKRVNAVSGLNLALCTVNLAEAAGDTIVPETLAEMYATAALGLRVEFSGPVQFLAVSMLRS